MHGGAGRQTRCALADTGAMLMSARPADSRSARAVAAIRWNTVGGIEKVADLACIEKL